MISIALALSLAGVGAPPINPPGIDCPKGFTFKRGQCWRRTTDDFSVFMTDEDEDHFLMEQEIERRIDELDRKGRRR